MFGSNMQHDMSLRSSQWRNGHWGNHYWV